MKNNSKIIRILIAGLLCLATLACLVTPGLPGASTPAQNPQNGSTAQPDESHGPGAQDLPNPAAGLQDLAAYQAVLTLSFDGSEAGQPGQWSETRTLLVDVAAKTRLLSITSHGLPEDGSLDGYLGGVYNGLLLLRLNAGAGCLASAAAGGPDLPANLEPASRLLVVLGAQAGASDTVEGLPARQYTFDGRALGLPAAAAAGDMALAETGGAVLRYHARIESASGFFGDGLTGMMTYAYTLTSINTAPVVALPDDCPAGLVDAPAMPGAAGLSSTPGRLEYSLSATPKAAADFYQAKLPGLGYVSAAGPLVTDSSAELVFTKGGHTLTVYARQKAGKSLAVMLLLENGLPEAAASPTPQPGGEPTHPAGQDASAQVSGSLTLLLGSSKQPSPLSSYHLEMNETLPQVDQKSGALKSSAVQLSADVKGADLYMKETRNKQVVAEGYQVGDQGYDVKNGKAAPGMGPALTWAMWPLDVVFPLSIASLGTAANGEESVDGRPALKFDLDSATADPATLSMLAGLNPLGGFSVTSAKGTAWVDKQTGALLKLVLDYQAEVKDPGSAKTLGSGAGHIDLEVTQVGNVDVKLP